MFIGRLPHGPGMRPSFPARGRRPKPPFPRRRGASGSHASRRLAAWEPSASGSVWKEKSCRVRRGSPFQTPPSCGFCVRGKAVNGQDSGLQLGAGLSDPAQEEPKALNATSDRLKRMLACQTPASKAQKLLPTPEALGLGAGERGSPPLRCRALPRGARSVFPGALRGVWPAGARRGRAPGPPGLAAASLPRSRASEPSARLRL